MRIPSITRILAYANGQRAATNDATELRHLDTLIGNLHKGMRARWDTDSGALLVKSANTRGAEYRVTADRCSCPAFTANCTHQRLRAIIVALSGDPPDEPSPLGDSEGDELPARPLGPRYAAARRAYAYT